MIYIYIHASSSILEDALYYAVFFDILPQVVLEAFREAAGCSDLRRFFVWGK